MLVSMTGYGREVVTMDELTITVEVRTVNHRFLDLSVKMPRSLLFIEDKLKKQTQNHVKRGRVDIFVTIEGNGLINRQLQVDWNLMDQYISEIKKAKEKYHLSGELSIDVLTTLSDLYSVQELEGEQDEMMKAVMGAHEQAMKNLVYMRKQEGQALMGDLSERIENIRKILMELEKRRDVVIEQYKERIKQRIIDYVKEEFKDEDTRILQEVALLAEKGDITEEVTRLFSHLDQFLSNIEHQEQVGRKLDFIVQEMHRETNTIGSKSNDVKISEMVVLLKSEIEKIKEQVQNVE